MKFRLNITAKLLSYLLVASLLPLGTLGLVALQVSTQSLTALAREQNVHILGGFAAFLRLHMDQVDQLTRSVAHNDAVAQALEIANRPFSSSFDEFNTRAKVAYSVSGFSTKGLVSLDLLSLTGVHFHIGETLNASPVSPSYVSDLVSKAKASNNSALWQGLSNNINVNSQYPLVSTVVREIQYFSPTTGQSTTVGALVVSLNDDVMRDYLARATVLPGQKLMKLDRNGTVELHSDAQRVGDRMSKVFVNAVRNQAGTQELILDGEKVLMDVVQLDAEHGNLVMITPRRLVTSHVDGLKHSIIALLSLGLLGIAALTWAFAKTVVEPIRAVSHGFRALKEAPLVVQPALQVPRSGDEMAVLVEGYNHYLQTLGGLEEQVAKRTESLELALMNLKRAHEEMIESEKLASLGRIVAAVAHELNTPIGNAVTVGSAIGDDIQTLLQETRSKSPRRSLILTTLDRCEQAVQIFVRSLDRAATLIGNFKQVAADQTSDQRRTFDLANSTEEILSTIRAVVHKQGCEIIMELEPDIACDGYPGAYGQILINLVMNAAVHAYPSGGKIYVTVTSIPPDHARLLVRDEGVGMSLEVQRKIYEPFFTTRLGQGGSGLGMSIVHGLTTKTLGGSIFLCSNPHAGTEFQVTFPRVAKNSKREHAELDSSQPANHI